MALWQDFVFAQCWGFHGHGGTPIASNSWIQLDGFVRENMGKSRKIPSIEMDDWGLPIIEGGLVAIAIRSAAASERLDSTVVSALQEPGGNHMGN